MLYSVLGLGVFYFWLIGFRKICLKEGLFDEEVVPVNCLDSNEAFQDEEYKRLDPLKVRILKKMFSIIFFKIMCSVFMQIVITFCGF